jgi:hypothetical protein
MLPAPDGFLPGYFIYLAAVFAPGIGFGELLGAWTRGDGPAEKLGYALAVGLAVDTLVLLVRASGLSAFGYRLLGLDLDVVYFLIVIGLLALTTSIATKRSFNFPSRPTRIEAILFLTTLIQAGVVFLFFQKFPIYPAYPSADFRIHAETAQGLISGTIAMLPGGLLYYAAQGQIALSILVVGGFAISTAERTMAILAILSPLVVYLGASRLFSNKMISLLVSSLYSLSGTVWYFSVFDAGLYANFFGILGSLFMLVAYMDLVNNIRRTSKWSVFLLAMVLFYMSHYSVVALLPAFIFIPFFQLAKDRRKFGTQLVPALVLLAPAGLVALLLPGLYPRVIAVIVSGGGSFVSTSFLSGVLAGIPVLGYIAGELNDDVEFLALMVLLFVYLVRFRSGSSMLVFPIVWFFTFVLAPVTLNTWRFAFLAIVPLILMAGFAIHSLTSEERRPGKKRPRTNISRRWRTAIVVGVFVVPIVAGSWTTQVISDTTTNTALVNRSQFGVYNATLWMTKETAPNATFLSLTDWHFSYLNSTIGRESGVRFFNQPEQAVAYARRVGTDYIIVTYIVTISPPNSTSIYPWNTFKPSANLTLAYSNPYVEIFRVA